MTEQPWLLVNDGDSIEKQWAATILAQFPNYERLWAEHVVPLTYRTSRKDAHWVRGSVPPILESLATTNYGVFVHLSACHEHLRNPGDLFPTQGVYSFYSRLYSARCLAERLLKAVFVILREYGGVAIPDPKRRMEAHGEPGLWKRYEGEFLARTSDYRGQQVHQWGFAVINGKIPRREFVESWIDAGLGALDRFASDPDAVERFNREFVDPLEQAREDLDAVVPILNSLWEMVLCELAAMKDQARYRADQNRDAERAPTQRIVTAMESQEMVVANTVVRMSLLKIGPE